MAVNLQGEMFFVEHHVTDREKFLERFAWIFGLVKDKSIDDAIRVREFEGHVPLATFQTEKGLAMCLWMAPKDTKLYQFLDFINRFTTCASSNHAYTVTSSFGLSNFDAKSYMADLQEMAKTGSVSSQTSPTPTQLVFVHHAVIDAPKFQQMMRDSMAALKPMKTYDEALPAGNLERMQPVLTLQFEGETDMMCIWETPAERSMATFQNDIDKFTGPSLRNYNCSPILPMASCATRNLSVRQYLKEFLAAAGNKDIHL